MAKPKFIEVTVVKIKHLENHPQLHEFENALVDYTINDNNPFKALLNVDYIENVYIEGQEDYLTALGFKDCTYFIENDYDDIKYKLLGV